MDVRAAVHCTVDDSQRRHFVPYQTTAEERLAHGVPKDMFKGAVNRVNTIVHEGRGPNMTLDAHSFELVHQKTVFFYNHPEKITEVHYAEMAGMLQRVTGAAHIHVFHHQLCADGHNADGNEFYTSPASATSDFGQTDFGQFFDRFWPIEVLTDFGQTDFGQF